MHTANGCTSLSLSELLQVRGVLVLELIATGTWHTPDGLNELNEIQMPCTHTHTLTLTLTLTLTHSIPLKVNCVTM